MTCLCRQILDTQKSIIFHREGLFCIKGTDVYTLEFFFFLQQKIILKKRGILGLYRQTINSFFVFMSTFFSSLLPSVLDCLFVSMFVFLFHLLSSIRKKSWTIQQSTAQLDTYRAKRSGRTEEDVQTTSLTMLVTKPEY